MVSTHTENRNLKQTILYEIMEISIWVMMGDKKFLDPIRLSDLRTVQTVMRRIKGDTVPVQENRKEKN